MNIDNNNIRTVRKIYACLSNAVNFDFICLIYHRTFAFIRFLENYRTINNISYIIWITREKHHHITLTVIYIHFVNGMTPDGRK